MSMREAILNFNKQFEFEPEVQNSVNLIRKDFFIVAGMGGSHLAADILQSLDPSLNIIVHSDYDLSVFSERLLERAIIIASSYSGNTEETISVLNEALKRNIPSCVISADGKIQDMAKEHSIPYIEMPDTDIQPRLALGFNIVSLMKLMGAQKYVKEAKELSKKLSPQSLENEGKDLAKSLEGKVPIIYSSTKNKAIAYNWKIKFNETGKIPAFYNVFPELNHNEMTGFDIKDGSKKLSRIFHWIFLRDSEDHSKILKRMEVTEKLYSARELPMTMLDLKGDSRIEKIFSSLTIADWASYYTADFYSVEAEQVPMVEEFKKLI